MKLTGADTWACPSCHRSFGRAGQSHGCSPAMTIDEYFATGPSFERPIFEVVSAFVATLGPVTVEPLQVGIFFKRPSSWIQLRPRTKWVSLLFPSISSAVKHPAITTKPSSTGKPGSASWFDAKLRTPADFDEDLRSILEVSWNSF
jgi:hypothetical protein